MTREEQIKKAAHDFSWGWCDDKAHPLNDGFIEGAKWADFHPQWIPVEEMLPDKTKAYMNLVARSSVMLADALVEELKKGGEYE